MLSLLLLFDVFFSFEKCKMLLDFVLVYLKPVFYSPDWSFEFALTEGRGVVSTRPLQMTEIAQQQVQFAKMGFVLYSEGFGDDVNKFVFVAAGTWADETIDTILADYERMFFTPAALLKRLELNWQGPPSLEHVLETQIMAVTEWTKVEGSFLMRNARLMQQVYRAHLDLFVVKSLLKQREAVQNATALLSTVDTKNVFTVIRSALARLQTGFPGEPSSEMLMLAAMLFEGSGLQLGYRFGGRDESGNSLDTANNLITNIGFYNHTLSEILTNSNAVAAVNSVRALLSRTDPGPGGFYDNLGSFLDQPHLLHGSGTTSNDPSFYYHAAREYNAAPVRMKVGFFFCFLKFLEQKTNGTIPIEWTFCAQGIYDFPLQLFYQDVAAGEYVLDVVYACDGGLIGCNVTSSLLGSFVVHPLMPKALLRVSRFAIPNEATSKTANMTITFFTTPGIGGNGRAAQAAEVWLRKE